MPQFHAGENRQNRRVVLQGGICEGYGVLSSGGSELLQFGRTNGGAMTRGMMHIQPRTRAQCHQKGVVKQKDNEQQAHTHSLS